MSNKNVKKRHGFASTLPLPLGTSLTWIPPPPPVPIPNTLAAMASNTAVFKSPPPPPPPPLPTLPLAETRKYADAFTAALDGLLSLSTNVATLSASPIISVSSSFSPSAPSIPPILGQDRLMLPPPPRSRRSNSAFSAYCAPSSSSSSTRLSPQQPEESPPPPSAALYVGRHDWILEKKQKKEWEFINASSSDNKEEEHAHKDTDPSKYFKCDLGCGATFTSNQSKQRHVNIGACDSKASLAQQRRKAETAQHGSFTCPTCNVRYETGDSLRRHLKDGVRCRRLRDAAKRQLVVHTPATSVEEGTAFYKCPLACGQRFAKEEQLNEHVISKACRSKS